MESNTITNITSIVTHPGGAHKDDFLACSVMLHYISVPIFRREPTPEDLSDPTTCVIDVGGEHTPELNNFDHHQFPRDYVPTCALSLVLRHLELYDDARMFCDWLETAEWFDTRGPVKTGKWLGVERDAMAKLNSPIDITCLRQFASHSELQPGNVIWEIMNLIGSDLVNFVQSARQRMDFIAENHEIWELGDDLKIIFMPRTEPMADDASGGLGKYIETVVSARGCVGMVYPDRRGVGYGLNRFNDDLRLEFTKVAECEDVHFAHNAGFIAKTSATEKQRLQELLKMSWDSSKPKI